MVVSGKLVADARSSGQDQMTDQDVLASSDLVAVPPSPLHNPVCRAIWIASIVSNIGTWVHEVGTGWLMTSLSPVNLDFSGHRWLPVPV